LVSTVSIIAYHYLNPCVEVVIAPPCLYLIPVLELLRKDIKVAAQNSYVKPSGAYTGEIRSDLNYLLFHISILRTS
jgi:triosephosphate isomerase (TIM)